MKKLIIPSSILLFALVLSGFVYAVTLTADMTEKVDIPVATYATVCVWDSINQKCIRDSEPILFGSAFVYPKKSPMPTILTFFFFRDKVYRSTQLSYPSWYNENIPEKESGITSLVDETGIESAEAFKYQITFNSGGKFITIPVDEFAKRTFPQGGTTKDLTINFPTEILKLQSIEKEITDISWIPQ